MKTMDHTAYPKSLKTKCIDSLLFIRADAHAALQAMPDGDNASYYADEICYISDELFQRKARASFPPAKRNSHTYKPNGQL